MSIMRPMNELRINLALPETDVGQESQDQRDTLHQHISLPEISYTPCCFRCSRLTLNPKPETFLPLD